MWWPSVMGSGFGSGKIQSWRLKTKATSSCLLIHYVNICLSWMNKAAVWKQNSLETDIGIVGNISAWTVRVSVWTIAFNNGDLEAFYFEVLIFPAKLAKPVFILGTFSETVNPTLCTEGSADNWNHLPNSTHHRIWDAVHHRG